MSMVMIKKLLCGKCITNALESENEIGLLRTNGGPVSIMGYLLVQAAMM